MNSYTKKCSPDTRMGLKDLIKRCGKRKGIKFFIKIQISYWYHKIFYGYYQKIDGNTTYYKRLPFYKKISDGD